MLKKTVIIFFVIIVLFCRELQMANATPVRANVTSGQPIVYSTAMTIGASTTIALPPIYSNATTGDHYAAIGKYTGYSFGSVKKIQTLFDGTPVICGALDYLYGGLGYYTTFLCSTIDITQPCSVQNFSSVITSTSNAAPTIVQYGAISQRPFQTFRNQTTGQYPSNTLTSTCGQFFSISTQASTSNAQLNLVGIYKTGGKWTTSSNGITFTSFSSTYRPVITYDDYDSNTNLGYTYYSTATNSWSCYQWGPCNCTCSAAAAVLHTITGSQLVNYYSNNEGYNSSATMPLYITASSTTIFLQSPVNGDLSLASGVKTWTSFSPVGCVADRGTIINWNNTVNPYTGYVHMYTMCNAVTTSSTVLQSGGVYEIGWNGTSWFLHRSKAVNFGSAVDLQIIGEYGQILVTQDGVDPAKLSMNLGLYSLYDPYNPAYIGYVTLSATGQNPVNSVLNSFVSVAADLNRYGYCGVNSQSLLGSLYVINTMYVGYQLASVQFCGNGNAASANSTYCDSQGTCCGDFCQYVPNTTVCATGNLTACTGSGYCTGSNDTCPSTSVLSNGTYCGAGSGICYNNNTCYGGTCTTGTALPNGTVIAAATSCQSAYYCDGSGNLVNGTYFSNTTLCNSGNVTYCIEPSYCTGSSATCPANTNVPNGTQCGVSQGICYNNNSCVNGVCSLGSPLPNGTIITAATSCQSAYYCDGSGNLVNGTYFSNTTLCNGGNVTYCIEPSYCTGSSATCPANTNVPNGTQCGVSQGICYNNNSCVNGVCVLGAPLPNGTIITAATLCMSAYYCDGAGNLVNGTYFSNTTLCNGGNVTYCIEPSYCTGTSNVCPANTNVPNGTQCGVYQGTCYYNNSCVNGVCTLGAPLPNGTVITPATLCMSAYYCDGSGNLVNGTYYSNTTLCDAGNVTYCIEPSYCTGTSNTCPTNTNVPNGTQCGVYQGTCYYNNSCVNGVCTLGAPLPNGTIITAATLCMSAYYCDGAGNLVNGTYYSNTTLCDAGNVTYCIEPSYCTGTSNICPANTNVPNGTQCGVYQGTCYYNNSCVNGSCVLGAPLPNGTVITAATLCMSAYYCDGAGNLVNGTYYSNTTLCNAGNVTYCIEPSYCTGTSNTCPANTNVPNGTQCGVYEGTCYNNNSCVNGVCTLGSPLPNGTIITAATSCQTAYYCDGAGNLVNGTYYSNTTLCDAGNVTYCIEPSYCTGSSATCPSNTNVPNGTQCGVYQGTCYYNNSCINGTCVLGAPLPNGTVITPATLCQTAYYCDGAGNLVNGTYFDNTTLCDGGNITYCIEPSYCTGSSPTCPANTNVPNGTQCGVYQGTCYYNNSCVNGTCVLGAPLPNGTVITAATLCQSAYYCDGAGNLVNGTFYDNTTLCDNGNVTYCIEPSYCTGSSATCPANANVPDGTNCGVYRGVCYHNNSCLSGICVTGAPTPNGTIITPATSCQSAYYCNGAGSLINGTYFSNTTLCNGGNVTYCIEPSYCTGSSATCPANTNVPNGTQCGVYQGTCYYNNSCINGTCVLGAPLLNGTVITPATLCQTAYYCDGAGNLVNGTYYDNTTLCNAGNVTYCIEPSYCTGSSATCPANTNVPNGTQCGVYQGTCYYNNSCIDGTCVLGAPLPNGTVITPATLCQTAYYCDGAGNLVNGTYYSNTTLCNSGNVSYCIAPSYCTGSSPTCPPTTFLPNGTNCGTEEGTCYYNNTCQGGICVLGVPYPNGTIVQNGTVCQSAAYCDGNGTVINGTYYPPTTKCRDGNVSLCVADTYCDGSHSYCPNSVPLPDGTVCLNITGNSCQNSTTCSGGACNMTNVAANGTSCPKTYPCSLSAECLSGQCYDVGLKPANVPCNSSANAVPVGICSNSKEICNGQDMFCHNTTSSDVCILYHSPTCNITGNCVLGNCIASTTCPISPMSEVVATNGLSLSEPAYVITILSVTGAFLLAILFVYYYRVPAAILE